MRSSPFRTHLLNVEQASGVSTTKGESFEFSAERMGMCQRDRSSSVRITISLASSLAIKGNIGSRSGAVLKKTYGRSVCLHSMSKAIAGRSRLPPLGEEQAVLSPANRVHVSRQSAGPKMPTLPGSNSHPLAAQTLVSGGGYPERRIASRTFSSVDNRDRERCSKGLFAEESRFSVRFDRRPKASLASG